MSDCYRNDLKLVVMDSQNDTSLRNFPNDKLAGHMETKKTADMIKEIYFRPGMEPGIRSRERSRV